MSIEAKRPRRVGSPGADPSRVLFVREILPNTSEMELQRAFENYGPVTGVFLMPQRRQALVEFSTIFEAEELIRRQQEGEQILVREEPIGLSFSKQAQITSPKKDYLSEEPTKFLLFTVFNIKAALDCETFKKICEPYGRVDRVSLVKNMMDSQAIIEMATAEEAAIAKPHLNGADIYASCNTLRCEYATAEVFGHLLRDTRNLVDEWISGRQTTQPIERARQMTGNAEMKSSAPAGGGLLQAPPGGGLLDNRSCGTGGRRLALFNDPPGAAVGGMQRGGDQASVVSSLLNLAGQLTTLNVPGIDTDGIIERLAPLAALLPPGSVRPEMQMQSQMQQQQVQQQQQQQQQLAAVLAGPPNILFLSGLDERMNCDRLFNVLCLYGNVRKIKFFVSTKGQAMAEMLESRSAETCVTFLHNRQLLGRRIVVDYSRQRTLKDVREAAPLSDGTPSMKEYDKGRNRNRFMTPEMSRKNQPLEPGQVLYFWGSQPEAGEEDVLQIFERVEAPMPEGIEFLNSENKSGFIYFATPNDALDAICLANHSEIEIDGKKWMIRMSFSVSKDGRRHNGDSARGTKRPAAEEMSIY